MDYDERVRSEIRTYKEIAQVSVLPRSHHYVAGHYLSNLLLEKLGVPCFEDLIALHLDILKKGKNEGDIEVLSLGSGNCDFELGLASQKKLTCRFTCYEINPYMLDRALSDAKAKQLEDRFIFVEADINKLRLEKKYDLVIANHSLHHFLELEHIFDEVNRCMDESSFFLISDMIGRNGHMFWDQSLDLCNRFWALLPQEFKHNHLLKEYFPLRVQFDCSTDGFEGIRAQDILPLLDARFDFKDFATFFSIANKFIDRDFGPNFDPENAMHKALLDMVWHFDDYCLKNKILKPTQIIGSMVKKGTPVQDFRYTYFEKPADVYQLDESRFHNFFDPILIGAQSTSQENPTSQPLIKQSRTRRLLEKGKKVFYRQKITLQKQKAIK